MIRPQEDYRIKNIQTSYQNLPLLLISGKKQIRSDVLIVEINETHFISSSAPVIIFCFIYQRPQIIGDGKMPTIGVTELIIVLAILLLVFGGSQIPKISRALGESVTEFKQGLNKGQELDEPSEGDNSSENSSASEDPISNQKTEETE